MKIGEGRLGPRRFEEVEALPWMGAVGKIQSRPKRVHRLGAPPLQLREQSRLSRVQLAGQILKGRIGGGVRLSKFFYHLGCPGFPIETQAAIDPGIKTPGARHCAACGRSPWTK